MLITISIEKEELETMFNISKTTDKTTEKERESEEAFKEYADYLSTDSDFDTADYSTIKEALNEYFGMF